MKVTLKVSVILNNYNYENFISEAIQSVLNQTYTKYELIIVDDGSTDKSRDVINSYARKYPNVIKTIYKQNGGQASAFNAGFAAASGDIIAFLDSDDYWMRDKLESVVTAHEKHAFVGHAKHFSNGKRESANLLYMEQRSRLLREYGYMNNMGLFTSTISFSRTLAEQIFPMPEEAFFVSADYYAVIFVLYYSDVYYLKNALSFYRIHGKNLYSCNQNIFGDPEKMVQHDKAMDVIVREAINKKLEKNGEKPIPEYKGELRNKLWKSLGIPFFIEKGCRYILYGTGSKAIKYEEAIQELGGIVIGYTDTNKERWGTIWRAKEVWSLSELVEKKDQFDQIIIASTYYTEIEETLKKLGFLPGEHYTYAEIGI